MTARFPILDCTLFRLQCTFFLDCTLKSYCVWKPSWILAI